jgi:hypothetical protein
MAGDGKFRPERFTDPELLQECTLSDYKENIYKLSWTQEEWRSWLRDNEWKPEKERSRSPKEDLAEFIRDIIAFANAARQRGETGYVLFGVEDKTKAIVGIKGQAANPNIKPTKQEKIDELNEREFKKNLTDYVEPAPTFEYRRGEVNGKWCSYLEILPFHTPRLYQVKMNLDGVKNPLRVGDCWLRHGESKYPITEEEKQFLYSWTTAPYIDREDWRQYFHHIKASYPGIEHIAGYQDLYSTNGILLAEEVKKLLVSSSSLLTIKGYAGCGKTTFIQDIAHHGADDLLQELELNEAGPYRPSFQNWLPIFLDLNSFSIKAGESLARELIERVQGKRLLKTPYHTHEPEKIFKDKGKKWLVLLDGFDEVTPDSKENVWSAICQLTETHQNLKVILTVRWGESKRKLPDKAHSITVKPLSKQQILEYLDMRLQPAESVRFEEIVNFLHSEAELWDHLRLPLFLEKAVHYFSGGEIAADAEDEFDPMWEQPQMISLKEKETIISSSPQSIYSTFDLTPTKVFVDEELVDEAEVPFQTTSLSQELVSEESVDKAELSSLKMGIFLEHIFRQLWRHNRSKKILREIDPDSLYEKTGEMAAHMAEKPSMWERECQKYLTITGLLWVLDLGVLLKRETQISFPTSLSKMYFATFFLKQLLENNSPELCQPIKGSRIFWERCLRLVSDLTEKDVSPLVDCIELLKGEN